MKNVLIALLGILLITSCTNKQKAAQDKLYQQVMDVHDELMPKMDDLMKLQKQIRAKIDSVKSSADSTNVDEISRLEAIRHDLENSQDAMMDWMHQFEPNFEDKVQEDAMKYLKDQKDKIQKAGEMTNSAIKEAQDALKQ